MVKAQLYGKPADTASGAQGSLFLLLDEPEVYGLPPDPVSSTRNLGSMWGTAAGAGAALVAGALASVFAGRRR